MLMPASSSAWGNAMGTALAPFDDVPTQRFLPDLEVTIACDSYQIVTYQIPSKSSLASDSYEYQVQWSILHARAAASRD